MEEDEVNTLVWIIVLKLARSMLQWTSGHRTCQLGKEMWWKPSNSSLLVTDNRLMDQA